MKRNDKARGSWFVVRGSCGAPMTSRPTIERGSGFAVCGSCGALMTSRPTIERGSGFAVCGSRLARAAGDVGPYRRTPNREPRTPNHEPRTTILTILVLAASVSMGAVPLRWTVETSRVSPVVFDAVRGETLALEAAFQSYGKPLAMAGKDVRIFWQTNGMGTAYWQASATVTTLRGDAAPGVANPTNVIAATFTPAMDPGSPTVTGFLGSTGDIYRAAFTLRFRNGPGATPNSLPLPTPTIDCANTTFLHPEAAPFSGGGGGSPAATVITNHVESGYLCTVAAAQAKADAAAAASLPLVNPLDSDKGIRWDYFTLTIYGAYLLAETAIYSYNDFVIVTEENGPIHSLSEKANASDVYTKSQTDSLFSTNNTALVSVVTNLAPSRARGLVLRDPVRNCNWYPVVTNGVFYWLIED